MTVQQLVGKLVSVSDIEEAKAISIEYSKEKLQNLFNSKGFGQCFSAAVRKPPEDPSGEAFAKHIAQRVHRWVEVTLAKAAAEVKPTEGVLPSVENSESLLPSVSSDSVLPEVATEANLVAATLDMGSRKPVTVIVPKKEDKMENRLEEQIPATMEILSSEVESSETLSLELTQEEQAEREIFNKTFAALKKAIDSKAKATITEVMEWSIKFDKRLAYALIEKLAFEVETEPDLLFQEIVLRTRKPGPSFIKLDIDLYEQLFNKETGYRVQYRKKFEQKLEAQKAETAAQKAQSAADFLAQLEKVEVKVGKTETKAEKPTLESLMTKLDELELGGRRTNRASSTVRHEIVAVFDNEGRNALRDRYLAALAAEPATTFWGRLNWLKDRVIEFGGEIPAEITSKIEAAKAAMDSGKKSEVVPNEKTAEQTDVNRPAQIEVEKDLTSLLQFSTDCFGPEVEEVAITAETQPVVTLDEKAVVEPSPAANSQPVETQVENGKQVSSSAENSELSVRMLALIDLLKAHKKASAEEKDKLNSDLELYRDGEVEALSKLETEVKEFAQNLHGFRLRRREKSLFFANLQGQLRLPYSKELEELSDCFWKASQKPERDFAGEIQLAISKIDERTLHRMASIESVVQSAAKAELKVREDKRAADETQRVREEMEARRIKDEAEAKRIKEEAEAQRLKEKVDPKVALREQIAARLLPLRAGGLKGEDRKKELNQLAEKFDCGDLIDFSLNHPDKDLRMLALEVTDQQDKLDDSVLSGEETSSNDAGKSMLGDSLPSDDKSEVEEPVATRVHLKDRSPSSKVGSRSLTWSALTVASLILILFLPVKSWYGGGTNEKSSTVGSATLPVSQPAGQIVEHIAVKLGNATIDDPLILAALADQSDAGRIVFWVLFHQNSEKGVAPTAAELQRIRAEAKDTLAKVDLEVVRQKQQEIADLWSVKVNRDGTISPLSKDETFVRNGLASL